jgi:hypothetical protein
MPHYGLELLAEPLERIIQTMVEHDHSEDTAEESLKEPSALAN